MKKIGILTMPNSVSFGASLQTYALRRYLSDNGYYTDVINYLSPAIGQSIQSSEKSIFRRFLVSILNLSISKKFKRFEKNIRMYPPKPIQQEALNGISKRYDGIVCGSDQVWNTKITGRDYSMFLDFCPTNVKKISYAPSFGIVELEEGTQKIIAELLADFDHLSIREESGRRIINSLNGRNAKVVVDPTFLIDAEQWRKLERPVYRIKKEYILVFAINPSARMEAFAEQLSAVTGLRVVHIGGSFFRNGRYCIDHIRIIGPGEWLYLLDNARYVITNSFHGIAFSVILRKNFFTEYSALTNTRLEEIIRKTGLQDRVIGSSQFRVSSDIDYNAVESCMKKYIDSSKEYLKEALSD